MAAKRISIEEFILLSKNHLVIDVRSPLEYEHAHFPDAYSIPIFSNEERKVVGTIYKQKGRQPAIKKGVDYFGVTMKSTVTKVEQLLKEKNDNIVIVYCWRGGMRSGAISWLLDLYGFQVYTLHGGYKNYRNWVLEKISTPHTLKILSGKTGSGKTEILNEMALMGQSVIDLEALASHKGSAFGALGLPPQPSNEQFENLLAMKLDQIAELNLPKPIWLESESSRIGCININTNFYTQMQAAPRLHIEIPYEQRLEYILENYGQFNSKDLMDAVERIKKRLGGLETKNTLNFLSEGKTKEAFAILLKYYDKYYTKSRSLFQEADCTIELPTTAYKTNARQILEKIK